MAKRGGYMGGMPGNMSNLMKQAQRMQRQMEEGRKALEEKEFTAQAGGGAVSVVVSGAKQVKEIKLAPEAVDPEDVEMFSTFLLSVQTRSRVRHLLGHSQGFRQQRLLGADGEPSSLVHWRD